MPGRSYTSPRLTKGIRMRTSRWLLFAAVAVSLISANAQTSSNVSVFATGFSNPRGLKWGPDGNLYVAEG
jgi:hypothetical protein